MKLRLPIPKRPTGQIWMPSGAITWRPITKSGHEIVRPRILSARCAAPSSPRHPEPRSNCAPLTAAGSVDAGVRADAFERSLRRPITISRLEETVETLKDDVLRERRNAETSQSQISALQQEKEISALSFKQTLDGLQSQVGELAERLRVATETRDALSEVRDRLRHASLNAAVLFSNFVAAKQKGMVWRKSCEVLERHSRRKGRQPCGHYTATKSEMTSTSR